MKLNLDLIKKNNVEKVTISKKQAAWLLHTLTMVPLLGFIQSIEMRKTIRIVSRSYSNNLMNIK